MSNLVRTSFSIERPLLARMEQMAAQSSYTNRSEFLRDMIRQHLVEQEWQANEVAVGTITLVYNHHSRLLTEKLTDEQHRHHDVILATMHVHLDEHMCVETILTRGPAKQLRELAGLLRKQKGVLHAALSMSSTGKQLV